MRTAALVIGIIASLLCLLSAMISFGLAAMAPGTAAQAADSATMAWGATIAGLVGFLLSGLATSRRSWLAGVALILLAVGSLLYTGPLFIATTPLFIIAGLLAIIGQPRRARTVVAAS